jgi:hypothetical protein
MLVYTLHYIVPFRERRSAKFRALPFSINRQIEFSPSSICKLNPDPFLQLLNTDHVVLLGCIIKKPAQTVPLNLKIRSEALPTSLQLGIRRYDSSSIHESETFSLVFFYCTTASRPIRWIIVRAFRERPKFGKAMPVPVMRTPDLDMMDTFKIGWWDLNLSYICVWRVSQDRGRVGPCLYFVSNPKRVRERTARDLLRPWKRVRSFKDLE